MTISASRTHEFNVGQICRLAYREAALLNVYQDMTAQQAAAAMDFFQVIVHSAETEGLFARSVEFETVTLVAGTSEYALDTSTLDVHGNGAYIAAGQTESELPVMPISREMWQGKGVRVEGGPPSEYYAHRSSSTVEVWLWPTPGTSEAGGTVRLQSRRLRADVTTSTVTPDAERFWTEYFVLRLAEKLAGSSGLGLDRTQNLERKAERALQKCRGKANPSTNQQIVIRHGRSR